MLLIGAAIFIPLGLLDVAAHHAGELDLDELTWAQTAAVLGLGLSQIVTALLGEIFFAGVVAAAVSETHGGHALGVRALLRTLPYWTLIAIDILFALGLAVTLLLLVVPAIFFLGLFALATPLAKIEHLGVRAAFRRSRLLVRGHLRLALLVLVPVAIGGEILSELATAGLGDAFDDSLLAEWAGATLSGFIATPIWALAAVALTYELLEFDDGGAGRSRERPTSASA